MATENPYRSSESEQSKPIKLSRNTGLFLIIVFLFFFGLFLLGAFPWTARSTITSELTRNDEVTSGGPTSARNEDSKLQEVEQTSAPKLSATFPTLSVRNGSRIRRDCYPGKLTIHGSLGVGLNVLTGLVQLGFRLLGRSLPKPFCFHRVRNLLIMVCLESTMLTIKKVIVFLLVFSASVIADEKPSAYQQRWAEMLQSETAIREIDSLLQRIEKSLFDLQLPASQTRELFAPNVRYVDALALDGSAPESAVLNASTWSWQIGNDESDRRSDLKIWSKFLQQVSYLSTADFKVIDGHFDNEERTKFVAQVSFSGLGNTKQELVYAHAKLTLVLQRESPKTTDWQILRWQTKSFETTVRPATIFKEVLEEHVAPNIALPLRRSFHEEASAEILREQIKTGKPGKRPFPTFDFSSWTRHPSLAVVDYDNDGFDDLFVTRRTGASTMLHNRGDGWFEDATAATQLTTDLEQAGFINAVLFADFDNDGDQDAFVGRSLYGSCYYVNEDGVFTNSPDAISVDLPAHVVSISAVDFNQDGLLDVYLSRYMPERNGFNFDMTKLESRDAITKLFQQNRSRIPRSEAREFAQRTWSAQRDLFRDAPGLPNVLLKNLGNGRFGPAPEGKALQVWRPTYQATWADFDDDGDPDVYLANDFSPNHLFRNDGSKFTDITALTGVADNGFGMGCSWGDYDADGELDLYVTNMFSKAGRRITKVLGDDAAEFSPLARGNSLFRQVNGKFTRVSGTTKNTLPVEVAGWGWGGQFVDVDNDGFLDIFAPAGYYTAPPSVRRPVDT